MDDNRKTTGATRCDTIGVTFSCSCYCIIIVNLIWKQNSSVNASIERSWQLTSFELDLISSSKGISLSTGTTTTNRELTVFKLPSKAKVTFQVWAPTARRTVPIAFDRIRRLMFGLGFATNGSKLSSTQQPVKMREELFIIVSYSNVL